MAAIDLYIPPRILADSRAKAILSIIETAEKAASTVGLIEDMQKAWGAMLDENGLHIVCLLSGRHEHYTTRADFVAAYGLGE